MRILHVMISAALLALSGCSHQPARPGAAIAKASDLGPHAKAPWDFVVASHEGIQVWFGQGKGRFQASPQGFLTSPSTTSAALGDLDSDGDLDLFVTHYEQQPNQVLFNDSTGHFRDSGQSLGQAENWRVALGDLDGDGDTDAFLPGTTSFLSPQGVPHQVWLNNGKGFFIDSGQRLGRLPAADVVLVDLDRDGDLDAVTVERGGIVMWVNQGKATFRQGGPRLSSRTDEDCMGLALGDLDRDGDLDILLARLGPNEVWLNRGEGHFESGQVQQEGFQTFSVALGDLDGDGDLDAFLANGRFRAEWQDQPNRVLFNNGKGQFTDSCQQLGLDNTLDLVLADCDGDGDLDALEANRASPNRLWLNDGKGRFSDSGQNLGHWKSRRIAVGSLR